MPPTTPWRLYSLTGDGVEQGSYEAHLVPPYGREHELWAFCWCEPDPDPEGRVFVHTSDH